MKSCPGGGSRMGIRPGGELFCPEWGVVLVGAWPSGKLY